MKMTIKRVWKCVTLATLLMLGVACSAEMDNLDMESSQNYITTFGMLAQHEQVIVADSGVRLHIQELGRQTSIEEVYQRAGRVFFNYTILGNNPQGGFNIRLNRFYPLEVRDMMLFEATTEGKSVGDVGDWKDEDFVSLLQAPAMPYDVSVGGGYININVCYPALSANEQVPNVALYYDVNASTDDTAVLQFVASSEEHKYDSKTQTQFLWFSFRITEDIESLIADASIYAFYWRWWAEEGNPQSGTKDYTSIIDLLQ